MRTRAPLEPLRGLFRAMTFNTDRVMSLSALCVGIGSLFVVVYQTELTRQAQYASVRPYLYISLMSNDEGRT